MRKLFLLALLLIPLSAFSQYPFPTAQPYQSIHVTTCGATSCTPVSTDLLGSATGGFPSADGVGYYSLSWTNDGSFTSCSVSIDSQADNAAAWSVGGIASTGTVGSCASQGSYNTSSAIFVNFARITPAIVCSSPGCVVTFTIIGRLFPIPTLAASGTVTSFSAGNLSPLFTTSVATATTTPALSFSLTNAAGGTVFGNPTGAAGAPSYTAAPVIGIPGTSTGTIALASSTASGKFTLTAPASAATPTLTLPTTANVLAGQFAGDGVVLSSSLAVASAAGTVTAVLANAAGGTILGNPTTSAAAPSYIAAPVIGIPGTSTGTIALASSTASGKFTLTAPASVATPTLTLPTTSNVLAGQFAGDGVVLSSALAVASAAGTVTAALANAGAGTILGNATGSAAAPTYTSTPTLGLQNTTQGTLTLAGSAASPGQILLSIAGASANSTTITPGANAGAITLTLPITTGTLVFDTGTLTTNAVAIGGGTNKVQTVGGIAITSNLFSSYNSITTAGQGVSWIIGATSQKSETTSADANVLTVTPPAAIGTYRTCVSISVSAATSGVISWTQSWTDSNGTAQSNIAQNLTQIQPAGTAAPAQSFTTSAAGNYSGCTVFDINTAAASIVVKWVGGGTTTAKMSAVMERLI